MQLKNKVLSDHSFKKRGMCLYHIEKLVQVDLVTQDGGSINACESVHRVLSGPLRHKHKLTTEVFGIPK